MKVRPGVSTCGEASQIVQQTLCRVGIVGMAPLLVAMYLLGFFCMVHLGNSF